MGTCAGSGSQSSQPKTDEEALLQYLHIASCSKALPYISDSRKERKVDRFLLSHTGTPAARCRGACCLKMVQCTACMLDGLCAAQRARPRRRRRPGAPPCARLPGRLLLCQPPQPRPLPVRAGCAVRAHLLWRCSAFLPAGRETVLASCLRTACRPGLWCVSDGMGCSAIVHGHGADDKRLCAQGSRCSIVGRLHFASTKISRSYYYICRVPLLGYTSALIVSN